MKKLKKDIILIFCNLILISTSIAQQKFTSGFYNYEIITEIGKITEGTVLNTSENSLKYSYLQCVFNDNYVFKRKTNVQPLNTDLSFQTNLPFNIIKEDSNIVYTHKKHDCNNETFFFKNSTQNLTIKFTGKIKTILFYKCEEIIVEVNNQIDTAYITKELPSIISPFQLFKISEGAIIKYKQKYVEFNLMNVALQLKTNNIIEEGMKILSQKKIITATASNYKPTFELTQLKKDVQLKKDNQNSFTEIFLFPTSIFNKKVSDEEPNSYLDLNDAIEIATELVTKFKKTKVFIFIEDDAALIKHCYPNMYDFVHKNVELISNAGKIMQSFNIRFIPSVAVIDANGKVVELEHFFFNKDDIKNRLFDALLE